MPLWASDPASKAGLRVIVVSKLPFPEKEIERSLSGNGGAQWYQAIVALIEKYRQAALDNGTAGVRAGNPQVMAGALSVHTALTELLDELDLYVKTDVNE